MAMQQGTYTFNPNHQKILKKEVTSFTFKSKKKTYPNLRQNNFL